MTALHKKPDLGCLIGYFAGSGSHSITSSIGSYECQGDTPKRRLGETYLVNGDAVGEPKISV